VISISGDLTEAEKQSPYISHFGPFPRQREKSWKILLPVGTSVNMFIRKSIMAREEPT
jgi:hypothetical protein